MFETLLSFFITVLFLLLMWRKKLDLEKQLLEVEIKIFVDEVDSLLSEHGEYLKLHPDLAVEIDRTVKRYLKIKYRPAIGEMSYAVHELDRLMMKLEYFIAMDKKKYSNG